MNNNYSSPFSRKLKKIRLEHGISQKDLAKDLDISRSCLANYETGKRQPDNDMLIRIADRFEVLVDYLVDRSEYQSLPLCSQELKECVRIKQKFQSRLDSLDLSTLDIESKIAVVQYYDYFDALCREK
ncbi:MAG: helix-turn-helix transcriptional regulator [Ruminococcaceae bacterium]|nr:helix-turn-helix transcriptional regulator [Oscillospiraceae bacterium]